MDSLNGQTALLTLLAEKKTAFLACEAYTAEMDTCPMEELEAQVEGRQRTLTQVAALDEQLRALCGGNTGALAALENSCDRQGLSVELGELYDASAAAKAVANRILKNEGMARARIEAEKAALLVKIKELNKGTSSVAMRYGRSVQTGISRPVPLRRERRI